jgi:hypothetical protein
MNDLDSGSSNLPGLTQQIPENVEGKNFYEQLRTYPPREQHN